MAQKAPGKAHRKGLTLLQVADMFGDEAQAEAWIAERCWPFGSHCPDCGSFHVQSNIKHPSMTHRCRDCPNKPFFSLRKGTVMEGSKLPYRVWAIGIYLFATNLKGVSSIKLHRELGITQKSAWFMLHRLRTTKEAGAGWFTGPVECDETHMGGKRANMSNAKRKELTAAEVDRGSVGKVAVVGAKDRATKQVRAQVVTNTDKPTLQGFVVEHTAPDATVYTDEAAAYEGLPFAHEAVKHSVKEFVRGQCTPTAWNRSGRCSNAGTSVSTTRCRRSTWTATSPSSRADTTPASPTPSNRWAGSSKAWAGNGSATANSSPRTGCRAEHGADSGSGVVSKNNSG